MKIYNQKLKVYVKVEEEEAEERRSSLAHLSLRQIFQHSIDVDDIPRWAIKQGILGGKGFLIYACPMSMETFFVINFTIGVA